MSIWDVTSNQIISDFLEKFWPN